MGQMTFSLPDEERKKIAAAAEESDVSQADYIRSRIRAGALLWESGNFNVELVNDVFSTQGSRKPHENGDTPPTTTDDISDEILRELPVEGSGKGVTEEELRDLIFGSEEKQLKYIEAVCEELHSENKVTRSWNSGLVKKDD